MTADEWPVARALKGEQVIERLMRIQAWMGRRRPSAVRPCRSATSRENLRVALVVTQDVSELKRAEDALQRAVKSHEQVLAIVAHDLQNPLNGILLTTQMLERRRTQVAGKGETKALEVIRRQAMHMSRLIEDLLDVSRIESGALFIERTRVAVEPLLREVWDAQQPMAAPPSVTLRLDTAGQPADVLVDRQRIVQVFENLIGDAIKFAPAGGVVSMGAESRGLDTVLWVADTGPSIAPEAGPHLFERFRH